jgi:acetyl-CoA synthetase
MYAPHVLHAARSYDALYRSFRWPVPAHYNIGVDVCDKWAQGEPGRTAIFDVKADGGVEEVSYGALRETSSRLANVLAARGIARGDRVAILLPQTAAVAASHIAIYKLGAIALPLAMLFGVEAISYRLQDSGAKALITNAQGLAKLAEVRDALGGPSWFVDRRGGRRRKTLTRAGAAPLPISVRWCGDDPALMVIPRHDRPPKGVLCPRVVLAFPASSFRMNSCRSRATGSGRRRTGPGPAACSTCCCRACTTACPWWRRDSKSLIRRRPSHCWHGSRCAMLSFRRRRCACCARRRPRSTTFGCARSAPAARRWSRDLRMGQVGARVTINEFYGQTECNLVLASCTAIGVSRPGAIGRRCPATPWR